MSNRKEEKAQYYIDNKRRINRYNRLYYENHFKEIKKRHKQWKRDNPEKVRKEKKRYNQTDEGRASKQRRNSKRRAMERVIINTLTVDEWLDILEEHNYRCAYCGIEFDCENQPQKDHVIPISKGGDNIKENIVPACRSCNSKKGDKFDIRGK